MSLEIHYFVHGTTEDNQKDRKTGQKPGKLSSLGKKQAKELGNNVQTNFKSVYSSDLKRAVKSANLAFGDKYEIIKDERLRECDYGAKTREKTTKFNLKNHINKEYPDGESYKKVEQRVRELLNELNDSHDSGEKIGFVSHQAPQLALEVITKGITWRQAIENDWRKVGEWQPGWIYKFDK